MHRAPQPCPHSSALCPATILPPTPAPMGWAGVAQASPPRHCPVTVTPRAEAEVTARPMSPAPRHPPVSPGQDLALHDLTKHLKAFLQLAGAHVAGEVPDVHHPAFPLPAPSERSQAPDPRLQHCPWVLDTQGAQEPSALAAQRCLAPSPLLS